MAYRLTYQSLQRGRMKRKTICDNALSRPLKALPAPSYANQPRASNPCTSLSRPAQGFRTRDIVLFTLFHRDSSTTCSHHSAGVLATCLLSLLPLASSGVATQPVAFAQQPAAPPEVTTLRWLMPWDEGQVQQLALPLIAASETQYPTLHIELQTIPNPSDYARTLADQPRCGCWP